MGLLNSDVFLPRKKLLPRKKWLNFGYPTPPVNPQDASQSQMKVSPWDRCPKQGIQWAFFLLQAWPQRILLDERIRKKGSKKNYPSSQNDGSGKWVYLQYEFRFMYGDFSTSIIYGRKG